MKVIAGIITLALVLILIPTGSAQMELSCTASQQVAIQTRLNSLPPAERQRFEADVGRLDQEMHQHHGEAKALETKYQQIVGATLKANPEIRDSLFKAVFEKRQDLVNKQRAAVLREQPELAEQAEQGDQEA